MTVLAKSPVADPGINMPARLQERPNFWRRWNRQKSLVIFVIGLGLLWLAVSVLLVLEIQ